ncbi:hypothetical protein LBMAG45_17470 [Nitrospirota bacterium]|nr:hypothetical protein LBMAG45_17470 [Nitrospirota bacterium]
MRPVVKPAAAPNYEGSSVPFHRLVPRGWKESAQKLAEEIAAPFSAVYEYQCLNDLCQVL